MTSQPEPAPTDATQASQTTKPLRELIALVLVGANALLLLVGVINLAVPSWEDDTFTRRAGTGFYDFLGLASILLPLLAVLLVTHVQPVPAKAKLITVLALAEYAFSALLGVISLLTWVVGSMIDGAVLAAFTGLLARVAYLAIFGVTALTVFKVWRAHFYVAKPKPQPGVYGQPQYGQPYPGYPQAQGQPGYPAGYPQAYGQPAGGQPPAGYGHAGQPGYPATYGQPGTYQSASQAANFVSGQSSIPAQQPGESTQVVGSPLSSAEPTQVVRSPLSSPQSAPPASAPPASGPPASAPPASAPPAESGSSQWDANERTQMINQLPPPPASGDDPWTHR